MFLKWKNNIIISIERRKQMISRKAKYVHIIWHPDLKFIPKLIKMINEKKEYFNEKDHLFITPHKRVYDELSKTY